MAKQLNRHAVPWEPNKVLVPQPPPAVKYQYPTNYYNISDQYSYYYYSYYYYRREEEEEFTYYNYYSSYNNNTNHHHHQSSAFVEPSSDVGGGQYGAVLRSSGEREVVKTYKRGAVRRIDGGGSGVGPTDLGGGLKRVLNVPPRFRGRFVQGRFRRRSFGLQWKPKAETSSKSGCGGGGSGGSSSGCGGGAGGKTSVMIKNIPNQYRRDMLIQFIDELSEKNQLEYDFLYLPMDFLRKNSLGYAFVNFTSATAATKIRELLQGYKWGRIQTHCGSFSSSKICEVTYARIQGKEALVQNFANSTFCCDNSEWLPVTFTPPRNGLSLGCSEQRTLGKWRARILY